MTDLELTAMIEAVEIRGRRPLHKISGKMVIEGPKINLEKTDKSAVMRSPYCCAML